MLPVLMVQVAALVIIATRMEKRALKLKYPLLKIKVGEMIFDFMLSVLVSQISYL